MKPFLALFLCCTYSVFAQNIQDLTKFSYAELDSLVMIPYVQGSYKDCIPYMQAGQDKAKAEFGEIDSVFALYTSNLAFFYTYIGDYKQAEKLHLQSIKIQAKVLGENHPEYAKCLNNLAVMYEDIGQYEKAEKYYLQSKELRAKVLGELHPDYAKILNNLGSLYESIGHYEKSEAYYLQAKNIWIKEYGEEHQVVALSLNNLAVLYRAMGNFEGAELLFLQAKNIRLKVLGETHPQYASSLNNLGTIYNDIEDYKKAEKYYLEAITIRLKTLGKDHPDYASSINNLAVMYQDMGEYKKAEPLYLQSKAINAKVFGENSEDYALLLNNLAILYLEMEDYKKSEQFHQQAKNIRLSIFGAEHPVFAIGLNNLAKLYCAMGKLDTALSYCLQGIAANSDAIKTNLSPTDFPKLVIWEYYSNEQISLSMETLLVILHRQYDQLVANDTTPNKEATKEKLKQYYQLAKLAMQLNERIRNTMGNEGDKLRVLSNNTNIIHHGLSTAVLLEEEVYKQEAFSFVELNKSILLIDAVKGNRARSLGDLPDSLVAEEIALQDALSNLKRQEFEARTVDEKNKVIQEKSLLQLKINAFLKSIKNKYPQYHALKYENVTSKVADIQALLDDPTSNLGTGKTALLEYFLTDSTVYLFVLTRNKVELYPLPIKIEELKAKIKTLRNALSNYTFILKEADKAYKDYSETAHWFYKNLIEIGIKNLKVQTLNIITDGELGHLPFETFLVQVPPQKSNYKTLHYLVNDYNISYNYSATLFKENKTGVGQEKHQNNGKMLACASSYPKVDSSLASLRLPYFYRLRKMLKPLPAAQKEIAALAENFQGDFLWNDSTNERFFKENAQNYSIIHLAMHGILDPKQPMLSSLAFTENRDSVEDNFLQAFEIARLKLNADLVVLSACETGYGKFTQGEGVVSIARSFMYAGVPSLVVSLWQVNDASTALIMKEFYSNLVAGMSKDAALRKAKMDYVEKAEGILAHPAFWSPFIQMGDSRPIIIKTKTGGYWGWILGAMAGLALVVTVLAMRRNKASNE